MKQDKEKSKTFSNGFHPLAQETAQLMDPILRKKSGLTIELLEYWPQIIGHDLAEICQPYKIIWPRRRGADNNFKPATLIVACEGFACLKIQHETQEIIQRLNGFFGFCAIEKIKIEQKTLARPPSPLPPRILKHHERVRLEEETSTIEDKNLRACLVRLGGAILVSKGDYS